MNKLSSRRFIHKFLGFTFIATLILTTIGARGGRPADAAPTKRYAVEERGDFVIFGNTMGQECAAGTPAPIVGTVGDCGASTTDSSPDVFWRADEPADGQAAASTGVSLAMNRTTSVLKLPQGAKVLYARLYWAALQGSAGAAATATFERPGVFTKTLTPQAQVNVGVPVRYQRSADVTADVLQYGAGAYRVSFADIIDFTNLNNSNAFASWYIVVFYRLDTLPPRSMVLYDGLDPVTTATPASFTLDGFLVPADTTGIRLGVVAFDGDDATAGDSLAVNGVALSDAQNPANNFFNSTRSILGVAETNAGDLPQLTGTPRSMSGLDIDIVDISDRLKTGDTSLTISAATAGDIFFTGAFVTALNTVRPDFTSSFKKTAVNLSRSDGTFRPGDQVEYTLTAANQGTDGAVSTTLTDTLAAGLTLVPGSLEIVSGANAGKKTDELGDDQAEYESATRTITFRIGGGASGSMGGAVAKTDPAGVLRFRVQINLDASGAIANQATITSQGEYAADFGNLLFSTWVSGNGTALATPTVITVTGPPPNADIALTFAEQLGAGEVRYIATVTNRGTDPAPQVSFTYQLPADSTLQELDAGAGWSCTQTAAQLTCVRAEPLAVGSAPTISFTVKPLAGQSELGYQAAAQATDAGGQPFPDPSADNNTVSGTTTFPLVTPDPLKYSLSGGGFSCAAAPGHGGQTPVPLGAAAAALLLLGITARRRSRA